MTNEWLSVQEAAEEIGVDTSYLRQELGAGRLHGHKHGKRIWVIYRADLVEWNANRRPRGRPVQPHRDPKQNPDSTLD